MWHLMPSGQPTWIQPSHAETRRSYSGSWKHMPHYASSSTSQHGRCTTALLAAPMVHYKAVIGGCMRLMAVSGAMQSACQNTDCRNHKARVQLQLRGIGAHVVRAFCSDEARAQRTLFAHLAVGTLIRHPRSIACQARTRGSAEQPWLLRSDDRCFSCEATRTNMQLLTHSGKRHYG
jgi:hypothetical protein